MDFRARAQGLSEFVEALFADEAGLVAAIEADGWSRPMATAGARLHRQSWDVAALEAAGAAELAAFGGVAALDASLLLPVDSVVHIWPALPGAGLTPLLFAYLMGVGRQYVRPSRRAIHAARHLVGLWQDVLGAASLVGLEPQDDWRVADVVVVSGSDETIAALEQAGGPDRAVIGYGHRVSMGLVEAGAVGEAASDVVCGLADDAVLWRGAGCFSLRGVVFVGSEAQARGFGARLGEAIAAAEARLVPGLSPGQLADRAQARGVAEFAGELYGAGLGWVELDPHPFVGRQSAPHVVTLHRIDRLDELQGALALPRRHLQGVALAAADPASRAQAARRLAGAGFTRICAPGRLQAPPAGWPHDGRPNVAHYLRLTHDDLWR